MNAADIYDVARFNERWRFKCEYVQAQGPRAAALASADPLKDPTTVKPMSRPGREVWGPQDDFPEVPEGFL
eukprot:642551-Lingulodinium_polyedra.AAC.1